MQLKNKYNSTQQQGLVLHRYSIKTLEQHSGVCTLLPAAEISCISVEPVFRVYISFCQSFGLLIVIYLKLK